MIYIVAGSFKLGLYSEVFPYSEVCYSEVLLYLINASGVNFTKICDVQTHWL